MSINWVTSPIYCEGDKVFEPLCPDTLSDADLEDLCIRMHIILDSIEYARCEGRLLPQDLFDAIDTLEHDLRYRQKNGLQEWMYWIEKFGEYYCLDGGTPIEVDLRSYNIINARFKEGIKATP